MSEQGTTKDQVSGHPCPCRAHPKHGYWLDIDCPEHGNRYKQDQERGLYGPVFEFSARRETEKFMDAFFKGLGE